MTQLYDVSTDTVISNYVGTCETVQTLNRITSQSIDGNTYIQVIGSPIITYSVTALVRRSAKALLEAAEANVELLRITVAHGVYYGRITSLAFSERKSLDWFEATMTIQKEVAL